MPRTTYQQRGINFEKKVADTLGVSTVPGSGNKFYAKGDCNGKGLLISCKSNKEYNWHSIKRDLSQVIDDSYGTGNIPLLIIEDNDDKDEYAIVRLSDFTKIISGDRSIAIGTKSIEKRANAEVPIMMR